MTKTIFKQVGETPLEAVKRFKKKNLKYKDEKISYAGRLDPMAEGELLLLIGDENKDRRKYEKLDKVYEVEFILGITTDSYDILGIIDNSKKLISDRDIDKFFRDIIGDYTQTLPVYSSYRVQGKPLFWWAKNDKLDDISIPKNKVKIYEARLLGMKKIKASILKKRIINNIKKVTGDFRQEQIIQNWNEFFKYSPESLKMAKARIKCSSGTYIRSIVNEIGGTVLTITRVRILQNT